TTDSNILVRAAVRPLGPAGEVLDRSSLPPHALVLSAPILDEVRRVLQYERIRQLAGISHEERDEWIALVAVARKVGGSGVLVLTIGDQSRRNTGQGTSCPGPQCPNVESDRTVISKGLPAFLSCVSCAESPGAAGFRGSLFQGNPQAGPGP